MFFPTAALAPWACALLRLGVSTRHLAGGLLSITGCGVLAGWLLAVTIDAPQVVSEVQLTLTRRHGIGASARWTVLPQAPGRTARSMAAAESRPNRLCNRRATG